IDHRRQAFNLNIHTRLAIINTLTIYRFRMGLAVPRPVLLKEASGAPKCKNDIVYMLNNSQVAAAGKAVAAPRPLAYA
ncbi:hypothetical protein, partial [Serratia marcescens]